MPTNKYDGFISYCHQDLDRALAKALQSEMQRYASPWYRARSLRIFRDDTDLSSAAGLSGGILQALGDSRWFILVASPGSAASPWVRQEIEWWLDRHGSSHLLIALADGEIRWAGSDFDWATTTALPPLMAGRFADEPLWTDLRPFRSSTRLGDAVAGLTASVRGVEKSDLVGEHIRHRRRTRQLITATITVLLLLLGVAVQQGLEAVNQRNQAQEQARVATARQLASLAQSLAASRLDLAQLFAVQAFRIDPNPQTRAALMQVSTSSPHLARYLQAGSAVSAVAGASGNSAVAVGTAAGQVFRWNDSAAPRQELMKLDHAVSAVASNQDGSVIVAADRATAVVWANGTTQSLTLLPGYVPNGVAVSPSGRYVAICMTNADYKVTLGLFDRSKGTELTADHCGARLAMPSERELVSAADEEWDRWSTSEANSPYLTHVNSSRVGVPINNRVTAAAGSGAYVGEASAGFIKVWPTEPGNDFLKAPINTYYKPGDLSHPEAFAISDDATRMAIASSGTIYVTTVDADAERAPALLALDGNAVVNGELRFYHDNDHLISASGDTAVLWDLAQLGRIGRQVGLAVPAGCNACTNPWVSISPDGKMIAVVDATGGTATVHGLEAGSDHEQIVHSGKSPFGPPAWISGNRLVLTSPPENIRMVIDANAGSTTDWDQAGSTLDNVVAASVSRDGSTLTSVSTAGDVEQIATATGKVTRSLSGPPELSESTLVTSGFGAISPDGYWVAILGLQPTSAGYDAVAPQVLDIRSGKWHLLTGGTASDVGYAGNDLLIRRPNGTIELWDAAGSQLKRSLPSSRAFVEGLTVNAAGTMIAQQLTDATVTITDLISGVTIGSLWLPTRGERVGHTGMAFTPDGNALVTVLEGGAIEGDGGTAFVWDLSPPALIDNICATVGRDLTADEWQRYVGSTATTSLKCAG